MFYYKLYDRETHKVYKSNKDTLFLLESADACKRVFKYEFSSKEIVEIPYALLLWGIKIGDRIIYEHDIFALNDLRFEVKYIRDNNGFYLLDTGTGITVSLTNSLFKTLLFKGIKYVGNDVSLPELT